MHWEGFQEFCLDVTVGVLKNEKKRCLEGVAFVIKHNVSHGVSDSGRSDRGR